MASSRSSNPYISLWSAVLSQAVVEARGDMRVKGSKGSTAVAKMQATAFLTRPNKDLQMICGILGLEMDHVISSVKRDLEKPKSDRPVFSKQGRPKLERNL